MVPKVEVGVELGRKTRRGKRMEMEASAVLRFAYATFAMRQRWEMTPWGRGGMKEAATMTDNCDQALETEEKRVHPRSVGEERGNERRIEALSVAISVLQIVLPVCAEWGEKAMMEREGIVKILDEVGHLANDAGALIDVVWVLVETLLRADGRDGEYLQRVVIRVLLSWCLQATTNVNDGQVEYAPTPYCDSVMEPVVATCAALVEDPAAFGISSCGGAKLLFSTLDALVSYLERSRDQYQDEGKECIA